MPSASLRPLTDDPGVLARLTSSSVTQEGVLTDKQVVPGRLSIYEPPRRLSISGTGHTLGACPAQRRRRRWGDQAHCRAPCNVGNRQPTRCKKLESMWNRIVTMWVTESSQHGHKHRKSYIRPVASANAELRAAIQNSSLTSQGTLVTSEVGPTTEPDGNCRLTSMQGVAWAQADAGGHLIDAHGAVIGEIVDAEHPQPQQGDREAAPQTTLQIRPIASATPELIQAIQQSALRSDGVLVNAQVET